MASFRSTFLARIGATGALLLSGCSLLPSVSSGPTFHADALVAADTWSFTDLTLRPSVQQALYTRDVMDLLTGAAADAGTDLHHLPTPSGRTVDFEKDLLPRLDGEVVVAVSGPTDEPLYIILIHTNDVDGTVRMLAEEATPQLTHDARGVTRYDPKRGADAVVGYKNWLIYSNSPALRDQTLDRIDGKGSQSLAAEPRYRSVVDRLKGDRLGYGYLDISPLQNQVAKTDVPLVDTFQAKGRMAYALGFEQGPEAGVHAVGMRIEYMPDAPLTTEAGSSGDALQAMDRLPRGSMLAFAGSNLGMYSQSLALVAEDEQVLVDVQTLLDQFAGPYAVGIASPSVVQGSQDADPLGTFIGGLFFLARLTPDADADQIGSAITTILDTAAADADQSDTWQHQVVVAEDWLAINAVLAPADLEQLPQDLLASDRMYQWVRPGFVRNGSNSYVNVDALVTAFAGQLFSSTDLAALSPIRAIGASAQTEKQGDSHAHIQVLIATK